MRKLPLRITVALITLIISVSSSWLLRPLHHPKPTPVEAAPCPTPTPQPVPQVSPDDADEIAEFPDRSPLTPQEISGFIEAHPRADLTKLWKRLNIGEGRASNSDFRGCFDCSVRLDWYDLDNVIGDEALLKISDSPAETFRYLVFTRGRDTLDWRLLGHVDEWGKYKASESFVVASGGNTWLVTQGQSASGSGVAYYHNRVFAVTRNHLKEVASYECEGYQLGEEIWPTKTFTTRILDIQNKLGVTRVRVEFNVNYSGWLDKPQDLPLFSKRQVAVFVSSGKSGQVLERSESTVTQHELDHIYRIDAMTEHDFFKYNLSELLNLAKRGTKPQKNWLKDFLKTSYNSAERQRLLASLAN